MNDAASTKPPSLFYWISGVALLWNVAGIAAYYGQVTMTPDTLAQMPEAQRALYENIPVWATSAYAIAVNAGALGCLLLLLRKKLALPILVLSLAGVVVQMGHAFLMTNSIEVLGIGAAIFPVVIIVIGSYLIWFANDANKKGWLT